MLPQLSQPEKNNKLATLASFKNVHQGETIIVCGCGESLNQFEQPERFITIGVNDIGRRFHPDYLVVVNPRNQFKGDRLHYLVNSQARYLFSQYGDLQIPHPQLIKFQLGTRGGTDFSNSQVLHYTQNSPYVALCLAIHMGAKRIGLIGVDFTDHHFFGKTGRHPLACHLEQIEREYAALFKACYAYGIEIVNLSSISRLKALPKAAFSWASERQFRKISGVENSTALNIVSYSTTPVAGVPAILARCITAVTGNSARCVWSASGYGNGVEFAGDIEWKRQPREVLGVLEAADLVIVHNGKVDPAHRQLLADKPVITMAHNYGWNVDMSFVEHGQPGVVVGQYQATLPEFSGWTIVPNPVPIWEPEYSPGIKSDRITIAYTPSGRHESYPQDHRLYWHGKGFDTTMRILERLAKVYGIKIESTANRQVSHARALEMKRQSHIVIDECVTGSYHRNSLEGLATGCMVVNGLGLRTGVEDALLKCAGDYPDWLFIKANLDDLENTLESLIALGIDELQQQGFRSRAWMESRWDFKHQWTNHWGPVIEVAMNKSRNTPKIIQLPTAQQPQSTRLEQTASTPSKLGLSVVLPFGGLERLPLLEASIAALHQSSAVDQLIIVELDSEPRANAIARRYSADYLFISRQGSFDKARALNVGSAMARNPEILWCDADLLVEGEFLVKALQEFRERKLDFFYPFSRIDYLNEADSLAVRSDRRRASECLPVRTLEPMKHVPGGMGLVKAELLRKFGGMIEGFLGWGGEDNAWAHKAKLIGNVGLTQQPEQVIRHLFHPDSGAMSAMPLDSNPHYADNVRLLDTVKRYRTVAELQRRFPPPPHLRLPWNEAVKLVFVAVGSMKSLAISWSQRFLDCYGLSVPVLDDWSYSNQNAAVILFANDEESCRANAQEGNNSASIVVLGKQALNASSLGGLVSFSFVLASCAEQIETLNSHGIRVWHKPWDNFEAAADKIPPLIVQPLSVLLGTRAVEISSAPIAIRTHRQPGLCAVIPYAGSTRLPLLAACLGSLAQCEGIDEIIVVELGTCAIAKKLAERWRIRYVFARHEGPFERARALNIGTSLANYDLVMWMDGDLLLPTYFAPLARAEMERLKLDYYLPHARMNYLSPEDSREVIRGTRAPVDCKPTEIWRGGISVGAIGIVRSAFVDSYGGMEESFSGWGYEDNAWWHKARLLGRTAVASDLRQTIYHLYHDRTEVDEDLLAVNKSTFEQIQVIKSAQAYLDRYPVPTFATCPWPLSKRLLFAVEQPLFKFVEEIVRSLREMYGCEVGIVSDGVDDSGTQTILPDSADALIVFGENLAKTLLTKTEYAHLVDKCLLVVDQETTNDLGFLKPVRRFYLAEALRDRQGLSTSALVEPLSLLLGEADETTAGSNSSMVVWTYWEGPLPDWIKVCLETLRKHAPNINILTPESFDELRQNDRDIDLQPLHVAHRADFIRAYLLAHFGGLWVDADCLLMRSPIEIFQQLGKMDFVAHRERQGWFSNGFIAARPSSRIAQELYQFICKRLRSGASLGWTSLGAEPLTDILRKTKSPWHELGCDLIQPVCWSKPETFFTRNAFAEHMSQFQSDALCYMLSNTEVKKYLLNHPNVSLLDDDTFFKFLMERSLDLYQPVDKESSYRPIDSLQTLPFMTECLEKIKPSNVLQIGTESVLWGALTLEWRKNQKAAENTLLALARTKDREIPSSFKGLDIFERIVDVDEALASANWCLIVFTPMQIAKTEAASLVSLIQRALEASAYVFLPIDEKLSFFSQEINAKTLCNKAESDRGQGLLLSRNDPMGLRQPSTTHQICERWIKENRDIGIESLSGPGSSLEQTRELRQRLPLLLQQIGVNSLLDAPCGDFNWMQHVKLGVENYFGIDLAESLIENNQKRYGNPFQKFYSIDIMNEPLPKTDAIFCRDCLVHFSFDDIRRTLRNFKRTDSRYLLTTHFTRSNPNSDIATGEWRTLNFEQAPFYFPKPLALINEKCTEAQGRYNDKSIALWLLKDLKV